VTHQLFIHLNFTHNLHLFHKSYKPYLHTSRETWKAVLTAENGPLMPWLCIATKSNDLL